MKEGTKTFFLLSDFGICLTSIGDNQDIIPVKIIFIMKTYGHLFGCIRLIKDTHHDEVFIERTNHVIMRNSIWLYDYYELLALAFELGYNPWKMTRVNLQEDL